MYRAGIPRDWTWEPLLYYTHMFSKAEVTHQPPLNVLLPSHFTVIDEGFVVSTEETKLNVA